MSGVPSCVCVCVCVCVCMLHDSHHIPPLPVFIFLQQRCFFLKTLSCCCSEDFVLLVFLSEDFVLLLLDAFGIEPGCRLLVPGCWL